LLWRRKRVISSHGSPFKGFCALSNKWSGNYSRNAKRLTNSVVGSLGDFIESARSEFVGVNVTIPHKVAVTQHLDRLSREAELIGAVNTVAFGDEVVGYNTDGAGCMKALAEAGISVRGKKVLLLGAGGAGRAILIQSLLEGAEVFASDVDQERASGLVREANKKIGGENAFVCQMTPDDLRGTLGKIDLFINATPVGMHPNVESTPIPAEYIPQDVAVMDIVYNPRKTKLLAEAEARGCSTVEGAGMLLHQGAEAFKRWFNVDPPVEVMRKALLSELYKKE